jgi:hypothetical protein
MHEILVVITKLLDYANVSDCYILPDSIFLIIYSLFGSYSF